MAHLLNAFEMQGKGLDSKRNYCSPVGLPLVPAPVCGKHQSSWLKLKTFLWVVAAHPSLGRNPAVALRGPITVCCALDVVPMGPGTAPSHSVHWP